MQTQPKHPPPATQNTEEQGPNIFISSSCASRPQNSQNDHIPTLNTTNYQQSTSWWLQAKQAHNSLFASHRPPSLPARIITFAVAYTFWALLSGTSHQSQGNKGRRETSNCLFAPPSPPGAHTTLWNHFSSTSRRTQTINSIHPNQPTTIQPDNVWIDI